MLNKENIIKKLQEPKIKKTLEEYYIKHLWLVGSHSRDLANDKSDVDFVFQRQEKKILGLSGISHLRSFLQDIFQKKSTV